MSLFKNPKSEIPKAPEPDGALPVEMIDLSKRYDIYCSIPGEDRLYAEVKVVAIRTFEKQKHEYATSLLGGYLEIETSNGARMMIPHMHIYMICEHGSRPEYTLLRVRTNDHDA